jgi:transmembrane sensor
MNTKAGIQFLFRQYLTGEASPEETVEFFLLVDDPEYESVFYQLMDQYLEETKSGTGLDEDQKAGILHQIFTAQEPAAAAPVIIASQIPVPATPSVHSKALWTKILAAAMVLIILSAAFFLSDRHKSDQLIKYTRYKGDIMPGGNKATLTLGDGTKVSLTDAADGKIAEEANVRIRKTADGRIVYEAQAPDHMVRPQEQKSLQYHTISTPAGGQYQVLLPDGTRVWLNAVSSLTYPATFANLKERRVELTGEAYFEVSKVKHAAGRSAFVVMSGRQMVEVLGTHFNVNTYQEEKASVTTLLEGSVRVSKAGRYAETIVPGEQAIVNDRIMVRPADTSTAVAWKNGIFKFDNANIFTVMNQLSRWYDLDVEYLGKAPGNKFNGEIYRNMEASKAFRILSLARIKFRLETPLNHQGRKKIVITQH